MKFESKLFAESPKYFNKKQQWYQVTENYDDN